MFIMTGKYTFYLFHQTFLKWDYYRPRCSIRVEQDKLEGHRLTTWDHSHKKCQQVLVPCFSWSWKISWIDTKKKKQETHYEVYFEQYENVTRYNLFCCNFFAYDGLIILYISWFWYKWTFAIVMKRANMLI